MEGRKDLSEHVADYLTHCRHVGHAEKHVDEKARHLDRLLAGTGATRLQELTADALERLLRTMREDGLSARTVNFARQVAVAFVSWCVKTGRAETNALAVVPKLDESRDRRRVRRPLTDEELGRLLAVAHERGRAAWYMAAVFAGLRRGDLVRLTWRDIDFAEGTITIRGGKARRVDVVPMHGQLAEELRRRLDNAPALPSTRVFPEAVTARTVLKDFERAGLARREVVTDEQGEPVMIGKGRRRRPKTRIVTDDDEGRVIDLHAMRTTLGTNLARARVAPQIAQRIMRHSDYRTTLKHYTVLGLTDTAAAIESLPAVRPDDRQAARATGTDHAAACSDPPQYPQQLQRESVRNGASACDPGDNRSRSDERGGSPQSTCVAKDNETVRRGAKVDRTAGDETRTRNIQLGRLVLYH